MNEVSVIETMLDATRYITKLKAEQAEARAKSDKELLSLYRERADLREQIAAKDAALRQALNYMKHEDNGTATDIVFDIKDALAAPARETE